MREKLQWQQQGDGSRHVVRNDNRSVQKKRFIVGCVVAGDDSLMRAALCHSYEEQQQTTPGFVWHRAPPRGSARLGAKLRDT
eukprot:12662567-Ditylum_brightwellii.AAC.1